MTEYNIIVKDERTNVYLRDERTNITVAEAGIQGPPGELKASDTAPENPELWDVWVRPL